MSFNTRDVAFHSSVGVLVIGLAGLAGCGSCGGDRAPREREPLSLIPGDSWIVASIEMGPVRASPAYKRALKQGNPTSYYLGGDCTYDPLPDIDRVWVGAGDGFERGIGAVIAFGPVDRDKVLECYRANMRRRGLSLEEVEMEGFTVYTPGPGRPHVAWLDAETLVVADRGTAQKVLALEAGKGKSIRSNQELLKLWERASRGHDLALAVLPTKEASKRLAGLVPRSYVGLGTATQALVGLRFLKGLDLLVSARLGAQVEAEKIHQVLSRDIDRWKNNDLVVIAGLSGHLKAIRVESAGPEVTATAHLTERQLDTLTRFAVDSVDEIIRDGDPEEALKRRLRGDGGATKADGGATKADGGATKADGGATKADGTAASRGATKAAP